MKLLRLLAQAKRGSGPLFLSTRRASIATNTISTTVDFGGGGGGGGGACEDDGPFFDLEFTSPLPDGTQHALEKQRQKSSDAEPDEEADEFELAMSPEGGARCGLEGGGSSLRRIDDVGVFSDGLFLKGSLLPLQPPLLGDFAASEPESSRPQVPDFLKPAAKFRAFKLGFRRKSNSSFPRADPVDKPFVNFKTEEEVPRFTRDISSRSSCSSSSGASRLPKDVLQRYISKIKPLYVRFSKRYSKKLRFSGPLGSSDAGKVRPAGELGEDSFGDHPKDQPSAASGSKRSSKAQDANIPAGLRVVCRRLRKSRSASAAVSFRSPSLVSGRRDDSLLEQQDGIQSAIAHCKLSFNRGSESPLARSRSDPGDGRSAESSSSCRNVI